jgi:hypothetical protein
LNRHDSPTRLPIASVDDSGDGDWADTGEQIASATLLAASLNMLSVPVPQPSALGPTYARFRISSTPVGLSPDNSTNPTDGEVEDYLVDRYQPQTATNIVITNIYCTAPTQQFYRITAPWTQ